MSGRRSYITPLSPNKGRRSMSDRRSYGTPLCLLDEHLLGPLSYGTRKRRESMSDHLLWNGERGDGRGRLFRVVRLLRLTQGEMEGTAFVVCYAPFDS